MAFLLYPLAHLFAFGDFFTPPSPQILLQAKEGQETHSNSFVFYKMLFSVQMGRKLGLRALLVKPKGAEIECFHTVLLLPVESQISQMIVIVNCEYIYSCVYLLGFQVCSVKHEEEMI